MSDPDPLLLAGQTEPAPSAQDPTQPGAGVSSQNPPNTTAPAQSSGQTTPAPAATDPAQPQNGVFQPTSPQT